MASSSLSLSAPTQNLSRLLLIRTIVYIGLFITCAVSFWSLELDLRYRELLLILFITCSLSALTYMRLRKPWPVTDAEFFAQLQIDLCSIALLLYFSGGASNPFISYLLVPICIAAATLKPLPSRIIAFTAASFYSLLLFYHHKIPALEPHHGHHSNSINLHILGMWLNFVISTLLITYFVIDMAKALRQREEQIHKHNEDNLRDEQLLAVATHAAGTAHELGTPLATMKVLLHEMSSDYSDSNIRGDLAILTQQVEHCSHTLKQLVNQAEQDKHGYFDSASAKDFCAIIIERWLLLNPKVSAKVHYDNNNGGAELNIPSTIAQSILSLLNNAADANPENITVDITITNSHLQWSIHDCGEGIPLDMMEQLGTPFLTSKQKGFGLGLFLSHSTFNRYNGSIQLYNHHSGGTQTDISLPLSEFNHGV